MTVREGTQEAGMAVDDEAWRGRMDTRLAVLAHEVRWLRWVMVVVVALQIGTMAQLIGLSRTITELAMRQ